MNKKRKMYFYLSYIIAIIIYIIILILDLKFLRKHTGIIWLILINFFLIITILKSKLYLTFLFPMYGTILGLSLSFYLSHKDSLMVFFVILTIFIFNSVFVIKKENFLKGKDLQKNKKNIYVLCLINAYYPIIVFLIQKYIL